MSVTAGLAQAQDGRIRLAVTDTVLTDGETTRVEAYAAFRAGAYAFASADFDVIAGIPSWAAASGGVILGGSATGISVSQPHNPFTGSPADPTNPLNVWGGQFAPSSYAPRAVVIESIPSDFWYYPSPLTASSVPGSVVGDRKTVFINPSWVGGVGVAPGVGTEMTLLADAGCFEFSSDTEHGGRETPYFKYTLKNLANTSYQFSGASASSLETLRVDLVLEGTDLPSDTVSVNFRRNEADSADDPHEGWVDLQSVSWPSALPDEPQVRFFNDGQQIATQNLISEPIRLPLMPHYISFDKTFPSTGDPGVPRFKEITMTLEDFGDGQVLLGDGSVRFNRIVISGVMGEPDPSNPASISEVSFDAAGPAPLMLCVTAPCVADVNGDGLVTPADFNAWVLAFNTQAPECDQNGDGFCTPADFNAWVINYNTGC